MQYRPTPAARSSAALVAAVGCLGLILQCHLSLTLSGENGKTLGAGLVDFFGFHTILTNLLVCIALIAALIAPASAFGKFFLRANVIAGIAANIAFVGLAYHVLLRHVWNPQGAQWIADIVLHYAVPALYVLYWLAFVPKASLRWSDPFWWGLYPIAYLIYALIRGEIIGSYPYGFIDVSAIGYPQTFINAIRLSIGFFVLAFLLLAIARMSDRAR